MEVSEVLKKYVAGLNSGDADQVAALYAEECDFVDGGARPMGFPDVVASGREGVMAAFKGVFDTYKVEANIVKLNPNSMEYDVELAGLHIPCIGVATCDEEGFIKEYIVRPR
ncbi:MAG: nuclear transport factor 2 family protein [Lachnospiraceae bacterium]|nr:nuclear transport factor 2 family protein [Lachnospiraceae bacterium]